ncbi:hypothetical protein PULV_a4014 [Pseudoalteromonas ulvae UL12]|uniref:hypothetical protein n=1 Tax=Pseudoalteromonas ulvae TaxID=107327 RepID=UPI00186B61B6|nr:hypothetical protein [Pseudoalteromonas ulvae]MBE0362203.1 hypothetical protein [Pseudoalteromonas ulvae UL12]
MAGKLSSSPALKLSGYVGAAVLLFFGGSYLFTSEPEVGKSTNGSQSSQKDTDVDQGPTAGSEPGALTNDVRQLYARFNELQSENNQLKDELKDFKKNGVTNNTPVEGQNNISEEQIENMVAKLVSEQVKGELGTSNMNVDQTTDDALLDFGSLNDENKRKGAGVTLNGYKVSTQSNGVGQKSSNEDSIEWIVPEGVESSEEGGLSGFLSEAKDTIPFNNAKSEEQRRKEQLIQYATIDADAILFGAISLNALIGVTPTDGSVQSPFQFKVELGQENLATSGVYMPDIALMRFSGYAVGEWATGCVEGRITSATFVFNDGAIASITPVDPMKGGGGGKNNSIGYLSDRHGTPCIKGEKHSTLLEYASITGSLSGLSAIGEGLSNAQFDIDKTSTGLTQAFTGNQLELAVGDGLSGGINAINQVVAQRYANVRDIVVAPAGEYVLNMTKQLNIDYDPNGRKLINDDFDSELEAYREEQRIVTATN